MVSVSFELFSFPPSFFSPPYCAPPRPPSSQTRQRKVCYGDGQPSSLTRRQRECISAAGHTCRTHITAAARPLSYNIHPWRLNNRNQFRPQSNYWGEFGVCRVCGVCGVTWAAVTARPHPPPPQRRTANVECESLHCVRAEVTLAPASPSTRWGKSSNGCCCHYFLLCASKIAATAGRDRCAESGGRPGEERGSDV